MTVSRYRIEDENYPKGLRGLPSPPRAISASGPLDPVRAVAIVGSRDALPESLWFAYQLAYRLARAGVVVVSGGAVGVDGAAHRGAIAAGGATWLVSPTGKGRFYPPEHRSLFDEVERSDRSRIVWPFPDGTPMSSDRLRYRNTVLVGLSEAVVVVQARLQSGSLSAANWARSLGRQLWVVPAAPWMGAFAGSHRALTHEDGPARPLCSATQLFRALRIASRPVAVPPVDVRTFPVGRRRRSRRPWAPRKAEVDAERRTLVLAEGPEACPDASPSASGEPSTEGWSEEEKLVFSYISAAPRHVDEIAAKSRTTIPLVVTALLTLSLKDVVVEGPDGFFRRP